MGRKGKTESLGVYKVCPICGGAMEVKWVRGVCGLWVCGECTFWHECLGIEKVTEGSGG